MSDLTSLVNLLKALSEPLRLRILLLLAESGELCVCDLVTILGVSQSMVSRHLAYLRSAGWVISRRDGLWMHYRILDQTHPSQKELLALLHRSAEQHPETIQDLAALRTLIPAAACSGPGRCC